MTNRKFCMVILSHGRPDRMYTLDSLKRAGYTGDYFILIDNEDKTANEYFERYGDKVVMFDKKESAKLFDIADNFEGRNAVVFARNACFHIAKDMGYTHFMQLDDDYTSFSYRFNLQGDFKHIQLKKLDIVIEKFLDFFEQANADCMAFAQGGDFIGGEGSTLGKHITTKRKAMNTMLCSTEKPFTYLGRINEDVNAYVRYGQIGKLFLTVSCISIEQKTTQKNEGGLTDIYLQYGTYVKSFYSILYAPSSVVLIKMGNKHKRIHHKVQWRFTTPCILNEMYKKV